MYPFVGGYYRRHLSYSMEQEVPDLPALADSENGFTYGLGMDVMKFHFSLTFRRDLTGVYVDRDNVFFRGAMVNLGYKFGGGL
jgi:hypothetical protein